METDDFYWILKFRSSQIYELVNVFEMPPKPQCGIIINWPVAQIPQCTSLILIMHHFGTEMWHLCTFLLQNGALWDICFNHCGIYEMGELECLLSATQHFITPWWCHQMETFSMLLALCDQWLPHTKASDVELWCFLWSVPEDSVMQTIVRLVIWDAIALIMTSP